jgi:alpha-L-rhamnosidase
MADKTGTLWEHADTYASCNHGFASHILVWMEQAGYIVRDEE